MRRRRPAVLLDRAARWARMSRRAGNGRRRLLIVQIDGLSHAVLERAIASGTAPTLARLVRAASHRLLHVRAGLPTSTPAFQAAVMYGGPVDIPAFEFFDKARQAYQWFPQPWTADRVEASAGDGRPGIMRGGRTYGCIFSGGAADSVVTFSRLLRPSAGWSRLSARQMLVPPALLAWVTAKVGAGALVEGAAALAGASRRQELGWRRRAAQRWFRELVTLGVSWDVYVGVPRLYANYVGYDVVGHALGPTHPRALRELRRIDRSLADLLNAVTRAREHRYDVFVLSDHGLVDSIPFEHVMGGQRPGDALAAAIGVTPDRAQRWGGTWAGPVCIVPAGPNVNIYLTDRPGHVSEAEIEQRLPGALARLAGLPGVGLILVRGAEGVVCHHRGRRIPVPPPDGPTGCAVLDRADRARLSEELRVLMAMPSAGDIMLFGHESTHGCVSFVGERGSHAGPSEAELDAFLLAPRDAAPALDSLASPAALYPLFEAYARDEEHSSPATRGGARTGVHARGRCGRASPAG